MVRTKYVLNRYQVCTKNMFSNVCFLQVAIYYCHLIWTCQNCTLNNKIRRLHERFLRIVYSNEKSNFEELLKRDGFDF